MHTMKNKIAAFLTSNNAWIYSVVLTVFSFMWVMTFVKGTDGDFPQSMVYLHIDKWLLFLHLLGILHILFIAFFIFSYYRKFIIAAINTYAYYSLWALVFIVFPSIFFGILNMHDTLLPVKMASEMIWMLANVLVFVELITNPNSNVPLFINAEKIKKKFKPEWILILIAFVLSTVYIVFLRLGNPDLKIIQTVVQILIPLSIVYLFYYLNYHFLVGKVYRTKGIIYYVFAFTGLVILFYMPLMGSLYLLPSFDLFFTQVSGAYWIGDQAPVEFWATHAGLARNTFLYTIPLVILIQWLTQNNKINQLSKEKSETELTMLKQQINPHFFFNTLNNVYSMSLSKDEQTPEAILQLSDLMRYVIYKGQEETVALSDEIKYIEDYLELQKMRLHKKIDLKFDKNIENANFQITPLLFIILTENAFKHGIEGAEGESYLHLSLTQKEDQISFICRNSIEDIEHMTTPGLGLINLKKRLELVYSKRYTLTTSKNRHSYTAELHIS